MAEENVDVSIEEADKMMTEEMIEELSCNRGTDEPESEA